MLYLTWLWLQRFLSCALSHLAVAAEIPQLSCISEHRCRVRTLVGHYIACMFVSALLKAAILWESYNHIKVKHYIEGFNHASSAMMLAHVVHIILLADFSYYYLRALWRGGGIGGTMEFSSDLALYLV